MVANDVSIADYIVMDPYLLHSLLFFKSFNVLNFNQLLAVFFFILARFFSSKLLCCSLAGLWSAGSISCADEVYEGDDISKTQRFVQNRLLCPTRPFKQHMDGLPR